MYIGLNLYISIFKRILDFLCSFFILLTLSPVLLLVALFIKLDSRGPVFFRQQRAGKNGELFWIYKFRTMKTERFAKDGRELSDFERFTPLGRLIREWSIDELPQLINICLGQMSLIGPRPLLPEYLQYYSSRQMRRHEVLPGLTGWAQVNGRNALTWEEKFEFDIWYVEHLSLKLDVIIFLRTISKIFRRDGINQDNSNTMERFDDYISKHL